MIGQENIPPLTSDVLKRLREKLGVTQQDLASMLNIGVATLSRWERGIEKPSGSAAAILGALAASMIAGIASPILTFSSGYAIYKLLKKVFENGKNQVEEKDE